MDAEVRASVSNWIRARRIAAGMTQEDLAAGVGVRAQTVWRWEQRRSTPSETDVGRVAKVIGQADVERLASLLRRSAA